MSVSFYDLRYFDAIIEHQTLQSAAATIGISQPALSKCLKRLEQAYGGALIEWRDGKALPTDIGRVVLRNAREILFRVDDINREVERVHQGEQGEVRFGAGPWAAEAGGKVAIARVIGECPHARVAMTVASWDHLVGLLFEKHLAFFIADVGDTLLTNDLDVVDVAQPKSTWFCRAGHPLSGKPGVTARELTEYPICGPDYPPRAIKRLLDVKHTGAGPDQVAPGHPTSVICDNWSMLRYLVQNSDCVCLGPVSWVRNDPGFSTIDVEFTPPTGRLAVVRVKSAPMAPLSELLLRYFIEEIRRYV